MKVFVSTDFKGHYPVGTAAIIVAKDKRSARNLLKAALEEDGLPTDDFSLREIDVTQPRAEILNDGDY